MGLSAIATAAALELPRVLLEDALALVLLYHRANDGRFERAALRWVGRLSEIPAVDLGRRVASPESSGTRFAIRGGSAFRCATGRATRGRCGVRGGGRGRVLLRQTTTTEHDFLLRANLRAWRSDLWSTA